MKVAVLHNSNHEGVIHRFGRPCSERYSPRHVQMVADALREGGHEVATLDADVRVFDELRRFLLPGGQASIQAQTSPESQPPADETLGLAFNMAYGIQGDARYTHVPAMLELAGVPYTGSTPLGHALALDKVITKILMLNAGVPTPAFQVMGGPRRGELSAADVEGASQGELNFPVIVKPRHESTSYGLRMVDNKNDLDEAVAAITNDYQQEALVEEYIDGREVCIGLLGNDPIEFLPPVELDFGGRGLKLMTFDDKYHKRQDEPTKVCPALLDDDMLQRLNQISLATFRACHLRDYARVDIRMDPNGNPFVLEVNSMASLGEGGSYVTAAKVAGYTVGSLINRIVTVASERSFANSNSHS